jgi:Niemann-Pick C2 protein
LDCGSTGSKVKDVIVSGCESTDTCNLPKGKNVSFTVDFTTNEVVSKATAVVHGIIEGIPTPFPFGHPDACTDSGLACPLKSSTSYTYKQQIFVNPSYPKLKLVVKWEVKDQASKDVFCVEVPVQIVDSAKNQNTLRFHPTI